MILIGLTFLILFIVWTMLVAASRADQEIEREYYQNSKKENS